MQSILVRDQIIFGTLNYEIRRITGPYILNGLGPVMEPANFQVATAYRRIIVVIFKKLDDQEIIAQEECPW